MKRIILPAALLLAVCLAGISVHLREPAGDTPESREAILRGLPKGINWNISSEIEVAGYIVSAITTPTRDGLAIFEPTSNGRYECRSASDRDKGAIVIEALHTPDGDYSICWLNRDGLDYAEISISTQLASETICIGAQDLLPVYTEVPAADHTLHISYYTLDGTRID